MIYIQVIFCDVSEWYVQLFVQIIVRNEETL